MRLPLRLLAVVLICVTGVLVSADVPALKPHVFAITNARVFAESGKVLDRATVVVRDGVIDAVGADVKVPADAVVIEGEGLTVYPGFIDGLSNWGFDPALRRSEGGPAAPEDFASEALAATKPDNRKGMTPEFTVRTALKAEDEQADNWRKTGFTAHVIAPDGGLFVGQSALVSLSGATPRDSVLRGTVAQHAALKTPSGPGYPRSLMGAIAHTRQTLLDAGYYQRTWKEFERGRGVGKRPPLDPALAALGDVLTRKLPVVFEADSRDEIHRALDFAQEFRLQPILYGGRDAWQAAERLKNENVSVILRLNFVEQPQKRLGRRTSGPFYESSQDDEHAPPKRVKEDQERQLKDELANAARLHKAGIVFAFSTQGQPGDKPWDKFREAVRKVIDGGLPAESTLEALTGNAARIVGANSALGSIAPGKAAHLVVTDGAFQDAKTQVCHVFADGAHFEYAKPRKPDAKKPEEKDKANKSEEKDKTKKGEEKKPDETKKPDPAKPEQTTEIESDRKPKTRTGGNVLLRNATILTVTNGTLEKTDLLIRNGKIEKIGPKQEPPAGVAVIEAEGMLVMPGIIDTHSHFAIAGGVNEFSLSVVPEVRVRDVIASDDVQIYRGLAGGVTTARLLHGSANCIGGQDAVIKLKYGEPASKLVLSEGPRGVKFALGENVKRTDGRFPNTRLGVEAVLIRAFTEAQEYRRTWEEYERSLKDDGTPPAARKPARPEPRRDLRLEALADILKGDLKVHCHCYRSDEILMLLRVANRFGFKVKSLQHVLEGYKIAPEIADHGASCSSFADWWAYKIEAYDAIPFNAALLHEAGAEVCLKSDSNELMRHLYQEAAKCVKYGGMSETDALKTITLNGARQLGLEKRLGSIEVGKDADLAIFNGHPLNSYSRVEMTLVDGEVYFQRSEKLTPVVVAKAAPTVPAKAAFEAIRRSRQGQYVITGATIHPVTGPVIENGSVVIERGKITAVLPAKVTAHDTQVGIDGHGLHVYPGMIDAATVLGLTELGSARETHDFSEGGDFQPDLRASTGINPDSELIPVTRANGVLAVVTRPIGSVVAGQSALINLAGWVPREMAVVDPLTLNVEFPAAHPMFTGDPTAPMLGRAIAKKQREEKVKRLKEIFRLALVHDAAHKANPAHPANPRLEALIPYAQGKKPVVIQANRKPEILEALKLADELKLKVVLSGAVDAWKVTEELKKRDVPVILGQVMTMPQEPYDPYDAPFACAAKLHEAGVRFCIRSSGGSNTRNLPYEAAMAVSYGLPPEEGLKAVTLYPAKILGVGKQLGSIEGGKRANLVIADGDILQASTRIKALFIDGRPLEPSSKHTRLYERYRERLREVKEGLAPLGTK